MPRKKSLTAKNVSASFLLSVLRLLGGIKILSRRRIQNHYRENAASLSACIPPASCIENQLALSDLRYGPKIRRIQGSGTMAYAGCEIISLYNAACHLKRPFSLPELIRDFEIKGSVISGLLGGSPFALNEYLKKHGFTCSVYLPSRKHPQIPDSFDGKMGNASYILCKLNNENRFQDQIHTVCITYEDGRYLVHNDSWCHFENKNKIPVASDPYCSLREAVNDTLANGPIQGRLLMLTKVETE